MYPCFVYADGATSAFPEDVQQFEKAVLDRSSRSRSTAKVAAVEDDSEKDKGSDSEDEDEAPKRRPVSAKPLCRVASIMIYETRSDQCKEKYYGFFARSI
jgi:hypothetical protein